MSRFWSYFLILVVVLGACKKVQHSIIAQPVAVTSIRLSKLNAQTDVGASDTLTATVTPSNATDKTIIWSSSDTSVAKVSPGGIISGKRIGACNITAATSNGVSAVCSLNVLIPLVTVRANYLLSATPGDELVSFQFTNNTLYPVQITKWQVSNANGTIIGSLLETPVDTLQTETNYSSVNQSFNIAQNSPGQTGLQRWPVTVYITYRGKTYNLAVPTDVALTVQL